jgi:chemotaxis protein methyltransferase CheR
MAAEYSIRETFDFIFFRNVLIYFERARQQQILSKVCQRLAKGGYLFVSHSETLHGLDLPVSSVGRSAYKKI